MHATRWIPVLLIPIALLIGCDAQQAESNKTGAAAEAPPEPIPLEPMPEMATPSTSSSDDPNVLAVVNGRPITKQTFALYLSQRSQGSSAALQSPQQQLAALNELISYTLVRQDAETRKMDEIPAVASRLELTRTRVLTEAALAEYFQQNPISDADLKSVYDERYGDTMVKEYKARHILLDTEQAAKDVIEALQKGADFAELAKQRSTGPSGPQGGDLGWFEATQMVKPFADSVAALEDGAYSSAPVHTQFGWHVILREQSRESAGPSFEEIREQLLNTRRQELMAAYIKELQGKAKVELKTPDVTGVPTPEQAHALMGQ